MENPLISVIIPAYNAGKYLSQCLENLLLQSYKNIEIIVIDDGSTDDTSIIVKRFPTLKYIYQPNKGVSAARNTGIDIAAGDYTHFMDADDMLTLDFYETLIRSAQKTESDLVCCGFYFERFPGLSQYVAYKTTVSLIEDKIVTTNVANFGACWRYLYKLSFLRKNKLYFDENRISGEDRIFSLQAVYLANRIALAPDALYIYKHRKNSVTETNNLEIMRRRHRDRQYAEHFQAEFAKKNNFQLNKNFYKQKWQYKLFGLPLISKKFYYSGKIRWYFLNIPFFQKKEY